MAEWVLSTKNEIPFFKASLFAGGLMLILLFIFLRYTTLGIWSLILAPGIAQNIYQNWKWPYEVFSEFKIKIRDIKRVVLKTRNTRFKFVF